MDTDTSTNPERTQIGRDNAAIRALLARLAHAMMSGDGRRRPRCGRPRRWCSATKWP